MNLNITPRLTAMIVGLIICCATSWANTNDHLRTIETTTSCDLNFTTDLIGVFCNEDRGNIVVNITGGTAPFKVEWDNHDFSIWAEVAVNGKSYTITGVPAGVYKIQVRDAFGCLQKQDVCLKDQTSTMDLTLTNNSSSCDIKGSIAVVVGNSSPPYWVTVDGPTPQGHIMNESVFTLDGLEGGEYRVTVRKDKCEATRTIKVTTNASSLALQLNEVATCEGSAVVATNITGGHPNYRLYVDGPLSNFDTRTSVLTHSEGPKLVQNLKPGTYNFTVIDQEGCTVSQELTVGSKIYADVNFSTQISPTTCDQLGHIGVEGITGVAPYNLTWRGPRSSSVIISGDAFNITDLIAGDYELILTDANGCITTNQVRVLNTGTSDISVASEATVNLCNQTGDIWVTPAGGTGYYTLSWTGPTQGSVGIGTNGYSITGVPSGKYYLTITDQNGCSATDEAEFNITTGPVDMTSEATANLCNQTGDIWVTPLGGTGPYTLLWTGPTQGSVGIGANGYSIVGVPSGKYHLTIVDKNGCSTTDEVEFNITTSSLTYSLSSTSATNGQNGSIAVSFGNGVEPHTVSWVGPVSNTINTNGSSYNIANLPTGNYSITVTDRNGCFRVQHITVANSARITNLNFSPEPTDQVGSTGGSIRVLILQGSGPYTVSWTGAASGTITTANVENFLRNLSAGTYTITVTDRDGNYGIRTVEVGFQNRTSPPSLYCSLQPMNAICTTNGSLFVTINGGTLPYQLRWEGPSSGAVTVNDDYNIPNLPAGTYTTFLMDGAGNTVSESAIVGVSPSNLGVTINGGDGTVDFLFGSGTPNYNVTVSGPTTVSKLVAGNATFSGLIAGLYRATVVDGNGCSVSELVRVRANNVMAGESVSSFISNQTNIAEKASLEGLEKQQILTLRQNYPNPSSSFTTIPFNLIEAMDVNLTIQDRFGKVVKEINQTFDTGNNQIEINSNELPTGIYYYTLVVGAEVQSKRMVIAH